MKGMETPNEVLIERIDGELTDIERSALRATLEENGIEITKV